MKNSFLKIPQLFPSRIPQLFFGATAAERSTTRREQLADNLYIALQILSHSLLFIGGIFGYAFYQFYGLILFGALGYLSGVWMRRSMGIRGLKPTTGFFIRMRERALGSRPGLLEWLLEKISLNEFTQAKCRAVTQAHERAVKKLKQTDSAEEQNRILADLDKKVKQILGR